MTELRLLDLREEVPEPPESLLALPDLHRRIRVRREWRRSRALLAIVLATAGIIFAVTRIGPTSTPPLALAQPRDGLIVFAEYSPGPDKYLPNMALYTATPAGTEVRQLTATSGRIGALTASLNGRKIAYDAETYQPSKDLHVTGDYVHVMDANGSDNRTVYRCPQSYCGSLAWSPDGARLLINGDTVLEPDGHVTMLCNGGCSNGDDPLSDASWSPDGKQLAFEDAVTVQLSGGTSTVPAIGTADADGTHVRLLTDRQCTAASRASCTYDSSPVWSTSGDEIAFSRMKPNFLPLGGNQGFGPYGPTGLYTMRSDGTAITEVRSCGDHCRISSIEWAPDGRRLAFVSTADPVIGNASQSTAGIADLVTGSVDVLQVPTDVSEPDYDGLTPAVAWAPSGRRLMLISHAPGRPASLYILPVRHATLGAQILVRKNVHPPLTWLPSK